MYGKVKSHRDTFMILGPSGSGKTCLFYSLNNLSENTDIPRTQLSLKSNETDIHIKDLLLNLEENTKEYSPSLSVRIVDIPGHPKLFHEWVKYDKKRVIGIVFMIDSANISRDPRICTEFLFQVITDPDISKNEIPILICCNKSDLPQSAPSRLVKASLYGELQSLLHIKRTSGIVMEEVSDVVSGSSKPAIENIFENREELLQDMLNDLEQKLEFFQQTESYSDESNLITFVSTSLVKQRIESLNKIKQWISRVLD